jgi:hypothetical protein
MQQVLSLPINVVSDVLNTTTVGRPRNNDRDRFFIHVSDVIETTGQRAFCSREQVFAYFTDRRRVGGKLTPGRRLLFARGDFEHEYIVKKFMHDSGYAGNIYAKWTCSSYDGSEAHSTPLVTTFDNAVHTRCKCNKFMRTHNEVDLIVPNLMLTGHPDMILLHNDIHYVFEFKSIDRADISFDDITIPMASHRLQISFYRKMMLANALRTSRRLSVVYVDRSNSKIFGGLPYKTLAIQPEPEEYMEPFKNSLLHVKYGIAKRKLPDRICTSITSERAKACNFCVECFSRRGNKIA